MLLTLLSGAPGVASMFLVWSGDYGVKSQWTLTPIVVAGWIGFTLAVRGARRNPPQTLRRLIRVIGHELNNSLTPIKSLAGTLTHLSEYRSTLGDWDDDMRCGLDVIGERSESLIRLMGAYARLARLSEPTFQSVEIEELVRRLVALQAGSIDVEPGPRLSLGADPDQAEQLLINSIRNAVTAAFETRGGVRVRWTFQEDSLAIEIEDDGPGFADTGNLFVPFFTTKARGSGIGLALSRQIAEAHDGTLELANRRERRGCRVVLPLPTRQLGRMTRY